FQGSTRPGPLSLPGTTLAINPYSRPQATARSREVPRGAQLLSTVRQSSGGGRDLYASPDGNVYLRKPDGWYRKQAGGDWSYFASTQGKVERSPAGSARGGVTAVGANQIRPNPNASAVAGLARNRVPD